MDETPSAALSSSDVSVTAVDATGAATGVSGGVAAIPASLGWQLSLHDKNDNDRYPEIRRRAREKNANKKHDNRVRFDCIDKFGYYCTESGEHNAEYNMFYIKSKHPELIDRFNIPLDEDPRRCVEQMKKPGQGVRQNLKPSGAQLRAQPGNMRRILRRNILYGFLYNIVVDA